MILSMRVLIRADASDTIGTGHIIRCISLAQRLKQNSHQIEFFCEPTRGNMVDWIKGLGFVVHTQLPSLSTYELTIIDHYQLGLNDEVAFRRFSKKIGIIDDWGTRAHQADWIIDPSISSKSALRHNANPNTPYYTGPEWLLLRDEFKALHLLASPRSQIKNIFCFFGGTDPRGMTQKLLQYLSDKTINTTLHFHVVVSHQHPEFDEIKSTPPPQNCTLHLQPHSIASIMMDCDFYLGSGGTITWERMCLGLTGFVMSVAENQEDIAQTLHAQNYHEYLGDSNALHLSDVIKKIDNAQKHVELWTARSQLCLSLIDGCGTDRAIQLIEQP